MMTLQKGTGHGPQADPHGGWQTRELPRPSPSWGSVVFVAALPPCSWGTGTAQGSVGRYWTRRRDVGSPPPPASSTPAPFRAGPPGPTGLFAHEEEPKAKASCARGGGGCWHHSACFLFFWSCSEEGEATTHAVGIRPSRLPAICPARLPARRPSGTAMTSRARASPATPVAGGAGVDDGVGAARPCRARPH